MEKEHDVISFVMMAYIKYDCPENDPYCKTATKKKKQWEQKQWKQETEEIQSAHHENVATFTAEKKQPEAQFEEIQ
nr:hypothetical protein BaRGS_024548 [Batillaria attramentaria]